MRGAARGPYARSSPLAGGRGILAGVQFRFFNIHAGRGLSSVDHNVVEKPVLGSVRNWYRECRQDPVGHPRANFLLDFVQDLGLITTVNVGTKVVSGLASLLPTFGNPSEIASYSPLDLNRMLVTVSDAVSIIAFAIIGVATLVKVAIGQARGMGRL